jgi:hypothetical protein
MTFGKRSDPAALGLPMRQGGRAEQGRFVEGPASLVSSGRGVRPCARPPYPAPKGVCGRAAGRYGQAMEAAHPKRSRTVTAIVLALVLFPLCAVPLYAMGHIADDFDANGGLFSLGQVLGVVVPAVAAGCVARFWAGWRWPPAVLLGIASWFVCGAALLVAFVVFFEAFA